MYCLQIIYYNRKCALIQALKEVQHAYNNVISWRQILNLYLKINQTDD